MTQRVKCCLQCQRSGFNPWVGKILWRWERLPTPIFWPGEFHGLYSPWGRKELDTASDFRSLHWETRGWWPSAWARVDKCLVGPGVLQPLVVASASPCWSRNNSPWHLPVAPCWDPPDSPLHSGLPGFWRKSWRRAPEDEGWADSGASCGCRQCTGWPHSPSRGLTRGHC